MTVPDAFYASTEWGNLAHIIADGDYFRAGKTLCGRTTKTLVPPEFDAPMCSSCVELGEAASRRSKPR